MVFSRLIFLVFVLRRKHNLGLTPVIKSNFDKKMFKNRNLISVVRDAVREHHERLHRRRSGIIIIDARIFVKKLVRFKAHV